MKKLAKTGNIEKTHLIQAINRVPAQFALKFKFNCKYDKFTKYQIFLIEHPKIEFKYENSLKDFLDKITTGNVEKIVRIHTTDKTIARYIIKYKPTVNGQREKSY